MQVRSSSASSAGGSSKSLLSNSQSKVCPEDSGIQGNTRHDCVIIYCFFNTILNSSPTFEVAL